MLKRLIKLFRCKHAYGPVIHIEWGMRKGQFCKECGKFEEFDGTTK